MKKAGRIALTLGIILMALCIGGYASAGTGEMPGALKMTLQNMPEYQEYQIYAYYCNETMAAIVMQSRYHNQLIVAAKVSGEWAIQEESTTALYQPGEEPDTCVLEGDGNNFTVIYGHESYTFEQYGDVWCMVRAQLAPKDKPAVTIVTDGLDNYIWLTEGAERIKLDYALRSDLRLFNINLMPRTIAEAKNFNRQNPLIGTYVYNRTEGKRQEAKRTVYAAPTTDAFISANGKAVVSLRDTYQVLGKIDDWYLVSYAVSSRTSRIGYIDGKGLVIAALSDDLAMVRLPAKVMHDTYVTDDPTISQFPMAQLTVGTEIICLATFLDQPLYVYAETKVEGKLARGFVPLEALQVKWPETRPDVEQQVVGNWRMYAGGTMYAEYLELGADGTCDAYYFKLDMMPPEESLEKVELDMLDKKGSSQWSVRDYDPALQLFWNDPKYMIVFDNDDGTRQCYGLTIHDQTSGNDNKGISLTDGEGGGGFLPSL